ncbi:hypothetical protein OKJ48_40500 [Streptomyces kunmingensis]|uniref:Uncharacterized protein n=1 Tax=Streptomyces kunmingensis TaxID=68225 RepID=A0ABU6CRA6_9ACTN|nr:hypothetical protein [Streptomyces kunmingensis]MEB3966466.1 hypothetical protein [Streptomyces kunmingensis]
MTTPTVPAAPAERLPRPAARRHALQLALLLGGLIGLGFLCGGQAHADDASGTLGPLHVAPHHTVPHHTVPHHTALREAAGGSVQDVRTVHDRVSGDIRAEVVDPVREKVVRPVLETVGQVTEPVGGLTGRVVGGIAAATPRPLPDGPPALPELPGLPGLPELPELPGVPGHSGPVPAPAPAPPAEPAPTAPVATQPVHGPAAEHEKHQASRPSAARVAGPKAYDSAWLGDVQRNGAHHASAARHTAAPQPAAPGAPPRPDGALVANTSAGDGNSTRHGEVHAAAFGSRVPVLLPPGAFASGVAAPVADRYRGIPEFPG